MVNIDNNNSNNNITLVPVSWIYRAFNSAIDSLILNFIVQLIELALERTGYQNIVKTMHSGDISDQIMKSAPLLLSLHFIYYLSFEYAWQRTPAKFISRTYVVNRMGEAPGFQQVLLRTLIRFVPFEAFSFFSGIPYKYGKWHDHWSKTEVISYAVPIIIKP